MGVKETIIKILNEEGVKYVTFEHEASGPSNLSRDIRAKHGYPDAVGAKALVIVGTFKNLIPGEQSVKKNILAVLPGHKQLDKQKLKSILADLKDFRFATKEELFELTGLIPGAVPPFGKPVLNMEIFIVDESLRSEKQLGFNVGSLTHSVVLDALEYFKVICPDYLVDISE